MMPKNAKKQTPLVTTVSCHIPAILAQLLAIIIALCLVTALVLNLMLGKSMAATYYVDASSGSDYNSGLSQYSAWKTIQKVNNCRFQPGDRILFKRGETWHGTLFIASSGTFAKPIVIGSYGDSEEPAPLVSGTYDGPVSWEQVADNLYRTTVPQWPKDPGILLYQGIPKPSIMTIESASPVDHIRPGAVLIQTGGAYCNLYVTNVDPVERKISGITFFRNPDRNWLPGSTIQVRQVDESTGREVSSTITISENGGLHANPEYLNAPGQWCYNSEEQTIYLYSESVPYAATVKFGQVPYGFMAKNQSHITLKDLAFRGFQDTGIYFFNGTGIKVSGVHIYGVGSNGYMTGILFHNVRHSTVENSKVEYTLRHGICIYAMSADPDTDRAGSNNKIVGNEVSNTGSDGISMATDSVDQGPNIQNNYIAKNQISEANLLSYDAAGIYLLNIGQDNRIAENTIKDCGSSQLRSAGIMVDTGGVSIMMEGNRIENNSLAGIAVTGQGHIIRNNILKNNGVKSWDSAQIIFFTVTENASGCTVVNNTMEAGPDQILFMVLNAVSTDADMPHYIDYNSYISANPKPFCWSAGYSCSEPVDFNTWKCISGTHIDDHSVYNQTPSPALPPTCENSSSPLTNPLTYYVSSSCGNDTNPGTSPDLAWKTINKVNASIFGPGDRILLKRGDIWYEGMNIGSSGSEGYPIEVGSYGDSNAPLPVLDGTYFGFPLPVQWQKVTGNVYMTTQPPWQSDPGVILYDNSAFPSVATLQFACPVDQVRQGAILIQNQSYYCNMWVTAVNTVSRQISGITFFRTPTKYWLSSAPVEVRQTDQDGNQEKFYLTLADPGGLTTSLSSLNSPGQWYWNPADKRIYLYSPTDPNGLSIHVGRLQWGLRSFGQKHLLIHDIAIRGFKETGAYFYECSNIDLRHITVTGTGANGHKTGILLHNTCDSSVMDNTVEKSLVVGIGVYSYNPGPGYDKNSWNNIISGNRVIQTGSTGISINTDYPAQAGNIINTAVVNNRLNSSSMFSYDSAGIYALNIGTNNRIMDNTVTNGGASGLRSSGIMIEGQVSPVHIEGNFLESNSLAGVAITGYGHKIMSNTIQFNATSPDDSAQIVFFSSTGNASGCMVEDNVIRSNQGQPLFVVLNGKPVTEDLPHTIDFNRYEIYATTAIDTSFPAFCWADSYSCNELTDFVTWQQASCDSDQTSCRDVDSTITVIDHSAGPDYDSDGDVDGQDLVILREGYCSDTDIREFATQFGEI